MWIITKNCSTHYRDDDPTESKCYSDLETTIIDIVTTEDKAIAIAEIELNKIIEKVQSVGLGLSNQTNSENTIHKIVVQEDNSGVNDWYDELFYEIKVIDLSNKEKKNILEEEFYDRFKYEEQVEHQL